MTLTPLNKLSLHGDNLRVRQKKPNSIQTIPKQPKLTWQNKQ